MTIPLQSPQSWTFISSCSRYTHVVFILLNCLLVNSDPRLSESDWDFYWCDISWMKEYFDHYYLEEHMKICHFRNHYEVWLGLVFVNNIANKILELHQVSCIYSVLILKHMTSIFRMCHMYNNVVPINTQQLELRCSFQ